MINVENVSKEFRVHKKEPGLVNSVKALFYRKWIEKHALSNVSLQIEEGEIIGLIGANGAGKTTLIKILAGIIHPSSGSVSVMGMDPWKRENQLRRQISLIMGQKAQLWWDLPASDGFSLLKEIYQIPEDHFHRTVNELSEAFDIKKELNVQVRRLSLGERMKVEIMAALLHRPKVVYLDEPTIGLDLTAQKAVRDFVLSYQKKYKPIVIITSHYMEDIERLCPRIAILKEGQFVYDGALVDIQTKYAKEKVVTAHLDPQQLDSVNISQYPSSLGDICQDGLSLKVHVPRQKISEASTSLLTKFPVRDLTIEEPEIGEIIESIMKGTTP